MNIYDPSVIRSTLRPLGFHFSKARGQNFLIDPEIPRQIAGFIPPGCGVLEIGPGFGALTEALLHTAERLTAIEVDRRLIPVLAARYADRTHFTLLEGDALRLDVNELAREHFAGLTPMVAANLPYAITSDILQTLLAADAYTEMLLMVQLEVAQRLCAPPAAREYGSFTIYTRVFCDCELLFTVSPDSFIPRPEVTSAVIRLKRRPVPLVPPERQKLFFTLTRAAFGQRRKTLLNALSAVLSIPKPALESAIRAAGLEPSVRGETLDIEAYAALCESIVPLNS